ncbi:hypothetical protein BDF19DRAFT_437480 [Syncephalis fuscata]|nr:hypothetical protein BDF19DRAFT_437480 [Syncephalis fuscata]
MKARNAAYAKNVLKRGQVAPQEEDSKTATSRSALLFLLFIVVGSAIFQLFNLL